MRADQGPRQFLTLAGVAVACVLLVVAGGCVLRAGWVTDSWPFPAGAISFVFIGAILVAIAGALSLIAFSGEWGLLAGTAPFPAITFAGMAVYLWHVRGQSGSGVPLAWPIACTALALVSLALAVSVWRVRVSDSPRQPLAIRVSFAVFIVALVGAGIALTTENSVLPWPVKPQTGVMIGWMFVGASSSFLYAATLGDVLPARPALLGFLVYDIVLLPALIGHFASVKSGDLGTLIVYVLAVVYSALLGIWYLFVDPSTRIVLPSIRAQGG